MHYNECPNCNQGVNEMSNLDVMIPADNECAYEQGWNDCLDIVMRKLKSRVDEQEVFSKGNLSGEWFRKMQSLLDEANSVRDMQSTIAWAQDNGMFVGDAEDKNVSAGAAAEIRQGFEP